METNPPGAGVVVLGLYDGRGLYVGGVFGGIMIGGLVFP